MALFLKQDDERSELQQKVAAELRRKAQQKSLDTDYPDGVDDSQYIKGTKQTTSLAWAWILILATATIIVVWLTVLSMKR